MNFDFKYYGHSGVVEGAKSSTMQFQPNLARGKVFFDQTLKDPLRFREAVSALHDVVIGDHRFKKADKTAYNAWKADQLKQETAIRDAMYDQSKKEEIARLKAEGLPPNFEKEFYKQHGIYWKARRAWAAELQRSDPALFRALVPCDPVVTVAPDTVFFECFAKDESSYGCLFVDRDSFSGHGESGLGTTNVDYSIALYDHFQTLRTYRPTRLLVDPSGFEVSVQGSSDYREEKIDLPPSWLAGFGQLSAAMALPTRDVELSVDAVYSVLAYLKRHREKSGPRSVKFVLTPGKAPSIVLEPWGVEIQSHGRVYDGERPEEIKVWGRRRLLTLARVLPLAERITVQLLGSGMPSIWTVHMGDMRFVLGLSGWTTNDWTSGANLDLLAGAHTPKPEVTSSILHTLSTEHSRTLESLIRDTNEAKTSVVASLHQLAKQGQVVYDFSQRLYRYRQVMPVALSEAVIGPPPPELTAAKDILLRGAVRISQRQDLPRGRFLITASVRSPGSSTLSSGQACEAIFDLDGMFSKAKCGCDFYRRYALRQGPCRHLLALRLYERSETVKPGGLFAFLRGHLN